MNVMTGTGCLLLAVVLLACPSCTALLWNWAGSRSTPGEFQGLVHDSARGDLVVYELDRAPPGEGPTMVLQIPDDWRYRPITTLAVTPQGNTLALAHPLAYTNVSEPPSESMEAIRAIDYQRTVGRSLAEFGNQERPYGCLRVENDNGEVIHEVYGYDPDRSHWVLLGSTNLGSNQVDAGRLTAGIVLTPLALAADITVIAAVIFLAAGGGDAGGIDFPDVSPDSPPTITAAERRVYFESLKAATPVR